MTERSSPDIVGVLRSVHSALDRALGDTDVSHIENDDELQEAHPVQWAAEWIARVIDLMEEPARSSAGNDEAATSPDGYRAAWLELMELCNNLKRENFELRTVAQPSRGPREALRSACAAGGELGCSCADQNYQWYGPSCETTMTSVMRTMLKDETSSTSSTQSEPGK